NRLEHFRQVEECRSAIAALGKSSTAPEKFKLGHTYYELGGLLRRLGKQEAEEEYHHAIVVLEKLVAEFPGVPEYRVELARSRKSLGEGTPGRPPKTSDRVSELRLAIAIWDKLVADFPGVSDYQMELASCHDQLMWLLPAEAEQEYHKALAIYVKLAATF